MWRVTQFGNLADLGKTDQSAAEHANEFDPPIYNIWKQQEKSNAVSHFGNSEVRWLDNLLYLYTNPFDIVVDPFVGVSIAESVEVPQQTIAGWMCDRGQQRP
jgi:hypothetical protein